MKKKTSAAAVVQVVEEDNVGIEANSVETVVVDKNKVLAAMNPHEYLGRYVIPKYAKKWYVAMPSKEEAKQKNRGWRYLNWDTASDTLEEVATIDEAFCTTGNVLCWRDRKIQDVIDADWKKKQALANRSVIEEDKKQLLKLKDTLESVSHGQISASPLSEPGDE